MRPLPVAAALVIGSTARIAMGEVLDASAEGFSLAHEVTIAASRSAAWEAAVGDVGGWWSDAHTISGDASAMTIDAAPLGCFCETVASNGSVVHLTVTFINPQVMLRMTGGLGPLGLMGVTGNMTWEFFEADEGTRVRFAYAVGGYYANGLDSLAGPVDAVIGDALQRLKAYVETGNADYASGE